MTVHLSMRSSISCLHPGVWEVEAEETRLGVGLQREREREETTERHRDTELIT